MGKARVCSIIILCLIMLYGCSGAGTTVKNSTVVSAAAQISDVTPVLTSIRTTRPDDTGEAISVDTKNNETPTVTITTLLKKAKTSSFFKDSVFLGDSITVGLASFVNKKRKTDPNFLGGAMFLARGGYALFHTQKPDGYNMHPEYKGQKLQPQKSLKAMSAKKVFIMLGVNDTEGSEDILISNYKKLINNIRRELPEISIYIIAVFPMTERKESVSRNNAKIDSINLRLLSYCVSNNIPFIDINPSFKNDGIVNKDFYRDDFVHLNDMGYIVYTTQLGAMAKLFCLSGTGGNSGRITNVNEFVNAREKPDISSSIVTTIPKDAKVTIIEKSSADWYKLKYNGQSVYVSRKHVAITSSEDIYCVANNVSTNANLRRAPNTASVLTGKVSKGTTLVIAPDYYSQDWYRVIYKGKVCYVFKPLVS